jgi:hypothetical protein
MPAPPKMYRLEFWPDPYDPMVSEWPELPKEVFRSAADARFSAIMFANSWEDGGYSKPDDCYWARDSVGEDRFRLTKFVVAEAFAHRR